MDWRLLTLVYLLYGCLPCSAVRVLKHSGRQVSLPLDASYGIQCTLLPPSYNTSCPIRQAMASHEEHLKAEFAKVIRHSVDDALNGTRKSNTAMYEATSYIVQVARTLNTTAIRVVSNEGDDAVCSSVFDDALAVSYDFAAIFVEVLDRASDRISFAWPCDAIAAIASRSLGVFSDVLALVCNNRRVQLEVIVNSSISALVASHAEVINAALELAAPGGPVGQLTVRKTDTRLEAAITTDTMIPVPMTV